MYAPRRTAALCVLLAAAALAVRVADAQDDRIIRARRLDADGRQDAAIQLYRQVLEAMPRSFDAHYGIARALDLNGDYAEARQHFSRAIELAPDDGSRDQALRMMGVSWTFTGSGDEAARYFEQVYDRRTAAKNAAGASEVANELGRVWLELGNPDRALRWYRTGYEAIVQLAGRSGPEVDLARFRWAHAQARIAIRKGDARQARTHVAEAKAILDGGVMPDQTVQLPYLTGYVAFYSQDYTRAAADLLKADQEDPFILLLLAQSYERSGDAARAREYYGKVLESTSHAINNAFARPVARRKLAAAQ